MTLKAKGLNIGDLVRVTGFQDQWLGVIVSKSFQSPGSCRIVNVYFMATKESHSIADFRLEALHQRPIKKS
jgi:hypothetical protein